jgi:hypothetical protein
MEKNLHLVDEAAHLFTQLVDREAGFESGPVWLLSRQMGSQPQLRRKKLLGAAA